MANQLDFSVDELEKINNLVGPAGSTGRYTKAYQDILRIDTEHRAAGLAHLDDQTHFWFQQAAEINADNQSSNANQFIREVTKLGRGLDGKAEVNLQITSNEIGRNVINQLNDSKGVPYIGVMIGFDIGTALTAGEQTVGGWGGSFYYDLPPRGGPSPKLVQGRPLLYG